MLRQLTFCVAISKNENLILVLLFLESTAWSCTLSVGGRGGYLEKEKKLAEGGPSHKSGK
jgi:hypothetical protein